MNACPKCGGPMKDLFSSSFCPNDCDRPKAEVKPVMIPKGTIPCRRLDDLAWFGKRALGPDHFMVVTFLCLAFKVRDVVIVDGNSYYAVESVRSVVLGITPIYEVTFKRVNVIICP